MKRITLALAALLVSFASLAVTTPTVVDVRWVRAASPIAEVRDGACVLYMADSSDYDLKGAADLVAQCLKTGGLALPHAAPPGSARIALYWAQDARELEELFYALYGRPLQADGHTTGFYHAEKDGTFSVVVLASHPGSLGHEIKHVFDGPFHNERHEWIPRADDTALFGPSPRQRLRWHLRHPSAKED